MSRILHILFTFLFASCSSVFYQPAKQHFFDPQKLKLSYNEVWFEAQDKTKLHGWFFPAKLAKGEKPKGTIVQFHGNAENISTHFYSLVWLIDHGYNLFTFDYRGYGKSEGKATQEGVYKDGLAAMEKGWELNQNHGKGLFIIYGQSTGGIISLRAYPDFAKNKEVDLLVQDASYDSYIDMAFDKMTDRWFLVPFSPLVFLLISDEYAADKVFEKITRPTLVIVGQKDSVVPQKFGKRIYKGIASQKKWLWKLPNGRHIDTYHHADSKKVREDLVRLLEDISSP